MAVNQFRQRLMAAGASPERAGKFIEERALQMPKSEIMPATPTRMPTASTKPRGPDEWYNEDYATTSAELLPSAFRAPKFGDKDFAKYFDFVFGKGSYAKVSPLSLDQAPNYTTAKSSGDPFEMGVVAMVEAGLPWPKILNNIKTEVNAGNLQYPTGLLSTEALDYAKDIWNEYNRYGKPTEKAYLKAVEANKDFQYQMPDRRLKYGTMTNFDVGTVDILTNPRAAKLYSDFVKKTPNTRTQAQYKAWLASEFTRLGRTPWNDERDRRDSLKGRRVKSGG